MEKLTGT